MNIDQVIAIIEQERDNYERLSDLAHKAHRTGLGIQHDGARLACDDLLAILKGGN